VKCLMYYSKLLLLLVLIQILETVKQFALSVKHHLEILLKPTLDKFQEGLESYRDIKASEGFLDGEMPTIGSLLDQMEDSFSGLELAWQLVKEISGLDFPISEGSTVPTASPRELLINLLVNRPSSVLQKIATGGDTVLGKFWPYSHLINILYLK
jgi:hypothetical protein